MKRNFRRFLALSLAAMLCLFCLTGCSLDLRSLLGMGGDDEEAPLFISAEKGGDDVPFPEGFDRSGRLNQQQVGDTLCLSFNSLGIAGRDTAYFTVAGDSLTVTAAATTDSERLFTYKAALWKKSDEGAVYEPGNTVELTADGELYTATLEGLEPGAQYKLTLSYDSGSYTVSGGMAVIGLASDAPAEPAA